jgi:hypothetical protein
MLVEEIAVARLVVDAVDDRTEVEVSVGRVRAEGDGDDWQRVAEADRPEAGPGTLADATDQDRVDALWAIFGGHRFVATEQVDLHEVSRAGENVSPLGQTNVS